jgi:membrane protease subunit (stomatin/prohibitin family)
MGTVARTAVVAGTASAVAGGVSRRGEARAESQQQQQYAADQQQATAPPAATPDDGIAKIKELGEMRSQGLLTDEEFAAAKAQILGT